MLPGALLGVLFGAGLAAAFGLPIRFVVLPENLLELIQLPTLATVYHFNARVAMDAVGLAFVASAGTLLCATAVSNMHTGPRPHYDLELVAQGVASTLCGVVGTLTMTGVISRSTANVQAAASTRYSAILHAVWVGLVVVLVPDLLAVVPMSSLAAVLVHIGFKLINVKEVRKLFRYGRVVSAIFVVTVVGVVAIELPTGILIGLAVSAALLLYRMSHVEFHLQEVGDQHELHLMGSATVPAIPRLAEVVENVPSGKELHIFFDDLTFIDHSCLDRIASFKSSYESDGGRVIIEWNQWVAQYEPGPTLAAKDDGFSRI